MNVLSQGEVLAPSPQAPEVVVQDVRVQAGNCSAPPRAVNPPLEQTSLASAAGDRKGLGVGVIGVGFMGQQHARALSAIHGARLVAVADLNETIARELAAELAVDGYGDYNRLLERDDIDGVIIATNDEAHVGPVKAAAAAGVDILLEKPIATTIEDAQTIIDVCEQYGVKLMIGFVLRFDPRYQRAKEIVQAGEVGEVESVFCRRTNLKRSQERLQGRVSVLSFLGVHDFDVMRWVVGSEVIRVHTEAVWNVHKKNGYDVEDMTWTILRFENGAMGALETGWILPETFPTKADFKLEVTGTDGMVCYDLTKQDLLVTTSSAHWAERSSTMLRNQLEHFVSCVRHDVQPSVTGRDGLAALEISLAAQLSARENRIVNLPL